MSDAPLTIERLGHRGDGIATGPVFVPLSLPGETVQGLRDGDRIDAPRIVTPSPDRVSAPCSHFKQCGGCALMHASDPFLARWKAEVVVAALAAHGITAPIRDTVTSPARSRRRATLAGRRTKKGALVGFHARRSDVIVPLTECHVLAPPLFELIPVLEQITRLAGSRGGTLAFALTLTETGIDCAVTGGKPLDGPLRAQLPQFRDRITRLIWDGEPVYFDAAPVVRFGGVAVSPPAGAFLQATVEGQQALTDAVVEATQGARSIADLFAGCGTFTLPLAKRVPVHAVEGAKDLTDALDHAMRHAQGLKPVTTEVRDLFRRPLLPETLGKFDAVVIDPPRAGAEAQTAEIAEAKVPRVAMVSCNPTTFARDAALLIRAGYRLNWVQVVDQFRWTPHVELAASLTLPHVTGE
jgi:23S rRNA (uracil1939-C5)-methyltransferase